MSHDEDEYPSGPRTSDSTYTVAFNTYAESFLRALLSPASLMPWVILQTNDGRVVYQSAFRPQIVPSETASSSRRRAPAMRPVEKSGR